MTIAYGTILDARYLAQGLALYRSWHTHVRSGAFYFFAMDQDAARILSRLCLQNARIVERDCFARQEVESQQDIRSIAELCWTYKPVAIQYMINETPSARWACYLDGDMALFRDPGSVLDKASDGTFGLLTPHRFGPSMVHWIHKVGSHNAGFAAFQRSPETDRVLRRWLDGCLAQPTFLERRGETFDQKILDHISIDEPGVADIDHPGINLAPWNADNYAITRSRGCVLVDDSDLFLYHFQSLRIHGSRLFTLYNGDWQIPKVLRELVYGSYVRNLRAAMMAIREAAPEYRPPLHSVASGWKELVVLFSLLARQRRYMTLA